MVAINRLIQFGPIEHENVPSTPHTVSVTELPTEREAKAYLDTLKMPSTGVTPEILIQDAKVASIIERLRSNYPALFLPADSEEIDSLHIPSKVKELVHWVHTYCNFIALSAESSTA